MKRLQFVFILVVISCLAFNIGFAQEKESQKGEEIAGLYFPKESSKQKLELVLVEDFENCDSWRSLMPPSQGFSQAKKVIGASGEVKQKFPNNSQYCLGVKEWSYKRGFNWVEITPPAPIAIVGKLKGLSLWVVGRNYRHRLEIWIKNYQGIEYPIDMGSLNFRGWKKLTARIPVYIPYYTKYIPQYKVMHITRFIVKHDPDEKNGHFYIYLDNLEAIVDSYDDIYDGDDMINEMGQERWEEIDPSVSSGAKGSKASEGKPGGGQ